MLLTALIALCVMFAGDAQASHAQAPLLKVGAWTLYRIVELQGGVGPSVATDLTQSTPRAIVLSLAADGQAIRLTGLDSRFSGEQIDYLREVELTRLPGTGTVEFGRHYRYDPCPPDATDCFGVESFLYLLRVVSPERAELRTAYGAFEGSQATRYELRFGPPNPDWIEAELAAPRCPGAPAPQLAVGEVATVIYEKGLNLRRQPRRNSPAIKGLFSGDQAVILSGPTCSDGLTYWEAQFGTLKGYLAEGEADKYWLWQEKPVALFRTDIPNPEGLPLTSIGLKKDDESAAEAPTGPITVPTVDPFQKVEACPEGATPRLRIGLKGRILPGDPNRLNTMPARPSQNPESVTLDYIAAGEVFTVLDGPKCNYNITWWLVEYQGTIGWTGEMEGRTYWAEPVE